jgi:hypothetical protein
VSPSNTHVPSSHINQSTTQPAAHQQIRKRNENTEIAGDRPRNTIRPASSEVHGDSLKWRAMQMNIRRTHPISWHMWTLSPWQNAGRMQTSCLDLKLSVSRITSTVISLKLLNIERSKKIRGGGASVVSGPTYTRGKTVGHRTTIY